MYDEWQCCPYIGFVCTLVMSIHRWSCSYIGLICQLVVFEHWSCLYVSYDLCMSVVTSVRRPWPLRRPSPLSVGRDLCPSAVTSVRRPWPLSVCRDLCPSAVTSVRRPWPLSVGRDLCPSVVSWLSVVTSVRRSWPLSVRRDLCPSAVTSVRRPWPLYDGRDLRQVGQLDGVYSVQEPHFWTLCSDVYVGAIKLEVASDADLKYIQSQTHNIFTAVSDTHIVIVSSLNDLHRSFWGLLHIQDSLHLSEAGLVNLESSWN